MTNDRSEDRGRDFSKKIFDLAVHSKLNVYEVLGALTSVIQAIYQQQCIAGLPEAIEGLRLATIAQVEKEQEESP